MDVQCLQGAGGMHALSAGADRKFKKFEQRGGGVWWIPRAVLKGDEKGSCSKNWCVTSQKGWWCRIGRTIYSLRALLDAWVATVVQCLTQQATHRGLPQDLYKKRKERCHTSNGAAIWEWAGVCALLSVGWCGQWNWRWGETCCRSSICVGKVFLCRLLLVWKIYISWAGSWLGLLSC